MTKLHSMCLLFVSTKVMCITMTLTFVLSNPEVQLPGYIIRGTTLRLRKDAIVYRYTGIPYAEPPVGDKPFRKTEALRTIQFGTKNTALNATTFRPKCPQLEGQGHSATWRSSNRIVQTQSEDCLYLNIYVPGTVTVSDPVPVMIWIGASDFESGQADTFDAEILSSRSGVIVVALNYRLGLFGFLSTGDVNAPGNLALWDQHFAMLWVKENIEYFGGNSSGITLVGWGAGASQVFLHALSNHSRGLFHRIICQSGFDSFSMENRTESMHTVRTLSSIVGCDDAVLESNDTSRIVDCLRQKPTKDLLIAVSKMKGTDEKSWLVASGKWKPTVDHDFVSAPLSDMLTNHSFLLSVGFYELDVLAGVVSIEGSMLLDRVVQYTSRFQRNSNISLAGSTKKFYRNGIVQPIILNNFPGSAFIVTDSVEKMYNFHNPQSHSVSLKTILQTVGDGSSLAQVATVIQAHSLIRQPSSGKTFLYLFDEVVEAQTSSLFPTGTQYGHDVPYLFGFSSLSSASYGIVPTSSDLALCDDVIRYWSNFVWSGNPNKPDTTVPVTWPEYESVNEQYIVLSSNMTQQDSIGRHLYSERVDFWINFLPNLYQVSKGQPTMCNRGPVQVVTMATASHHPTQTTATTKTTKSAFVIPTEALTTTAKPLAVTIFELPSIVRNFTTKRRKTTIRTTKQPPRQLTTCQTVNMARLERFNMDVAMAETTIISLIAVSAILGLLALVVSCMLCARKRSDPDMGKF